MKLESNYNVNIYEFEYTDDGTFYEGDTFTAYIRIIEREDKKQVDLFWETESSYYLYWVISKEYGPDDLEFNMSVEKLKEELCSSIGKNGNYKEGDLNEVLREHLIHRTFNERIRPDNLIETKAILV